jgi:hypothetical protein
MRSREAFHFMAPPAAIAAPALFKHRRRRHKLESCSNRVMSSASFWSDACKNALDKPLQTLLDALYGSCGATVRRARAADCALLAAV